MAHAPPQPVSLAYRAAIVLLVTGVNAVPGVLLSIGELPTESIVGGIIAYLVGFAGLTMLPVVQRLLARRYVRSAIWIILIARVASMLVMFGMIVDFMIAMIAAEIAGAQPSIAPGGAPHHNTVGQGLIAVAIHSILISGVFWLVVAGMAFLLKLLRPEPRIEGFCPACGYDLRATPRRCPECGTAVVPIANSSW